MNMENLKQELFFMIKPDWLKNKEKILNFLEERWFPLDFWILVDFNEKLLDIIYGWDDKWLYDLHKKYYLNEKEYKKVFLWFTRWTIEELRKVAWKNCSHKLCKENTIRNKFWTWFVKLWQQKYFLNSIHTPENEEELKENLKVKEYILKIKKDMKNIVNIILVNKNMEILLVKRNKKSLYYPWKWSLPWWTCENWETLEETLFREIQEETKWEIKNYKYLTSLFVDWNRAVYYVWELKNSDKIILNKEHEDYMWINPKVIKVDLAFKQNDVINLYNKNNKNV